MKPRSDDGLRDEYQDLELEPDEGELRVIRILEAGYYAVAPPAGAEPRGVAPSTDRRDVRRAGRTPIRLRSATVVGLAAAAVLLVAGGVAWALGVTDLGKPTGATATYTPKILSGFHRIGAPAHSFGRADVIFVGTEYDGTSAAERWPVVKALDQFGTFSRIKATDGGVTTTTGAASDEPPLSVPIATFDWSHAIYRSPYVYFDHVDLLNRTFHEFQNPKGLARSLYLRYSQYTGPAGWTRDPLRAKATILSSPATSDRKLPLIYAGGYVQTVSYNVNVSDFTKPSSATGGLAGLTFNEVQTQLLNRQSGLLVHDVNAETNVMVALICHGDGNRPSSVCGRSVIRKILKKVK